MTRETPEVPERKMLRFRLLPLTAVAVLTPPERGVRIVDENIETPDLESDADPVGIAFMTAPARIPMRFRGTS